MKRIKCTNLIKGVSDRLGFCHGNNLQWKSNYWHS